MEATLRADVLNAMRETEEFVFSVTDGDLPDLSRDQMQAQHAFVTCLRDMYADFQQRIIASQATETLRRSEIASRDIILCRFFALIDCIEETIDRLPMETVPSPQSLQFRAVSSTVMMALFNKSQQILQQQPEQLHPVTPAHSNTASSSEISCSFAAHSCESPQVKQSKVTAPASFARKRQLYAPSESPVAPAATQLAANSPNFSQLSLDSEESEVRLYGRRGDDCIMTELNTLSRLCDSTLPHISMPCSVTNTEPQSQSPAVKQSNPSLATCHVSTAAPTCRCCLNVPHHSANLTDSPPVMPNVRPLTIVRNLDLCRSCPPEAVAASTSPECITIWDRHKVHCQGKIVNDALAKPLAPSSSSAIPAAIAQSSPASDDPSTSQSSPESPSRAATDASRYSLPTLVPPLATGLADTPSVDQETFPCHDLSDRTSMDPELCNPTPCSDRISLSSGRFSNPTGSNLPRQSAQAMGHFRARNRRLLPETFGAILPGLSDTDAIHFASRVRPPEILPDVPAQRSSYRSAAPLMTQLSEDSGQKGFSNLIDLGLPHAHEEDLGAIVVGEPPPLSPCGDNNACVSAVDVSPAQRSSYRSAAPLMTQLSEDSVQKGFSSNLIDIGFPRAHEKDSRAIVVGEPPPPCLRGRNDACVSAMSAHCVKTEHLPKDLMVCFSPPELPSNSNDDLMPFHSPLTAQGSPSELSLPSSCDSRPEGVTIQFIPTGTLEAAFTTLDSTFDAFKCQWPVEPARITQPHMMTMAYPTDMPARSIDSVAILLEVANAVASTTHGVEIVWEDPRPPEKGRGWISARKKDLTTSPLLDAGFHLSSFVTEDLHLRGNLLIAGLGVCGVTEDIPPLKILSQLLTAILSPSRGA